MSRLYYIQSRGYSGDCLLWWRENRCGYTMNLDEALKLPEQEARTLCAGRPDEDFAWPVEEIDQVAERHVNSERFPGGANEPGGVDERLRRIRT